MFHDQPTTALIVSNDQFTAEARLREAWLYETSTEPRGIRVVDHPVDGADSSVIANLVSTIAKCFTTDEQHTDPGLVSLAKARLDEMATAGTPRVVILVNASGLTAGDLVQVRITFPGLTVLVASGCDFDVVRKWRDHSDWTMLSPIADDVVEFESLLALESQARIESDIGLRALDDLPDAKGT